MSDLTARPARIVERLGSRTVWEIRLAGGQACFMVSDVDDDALLLVDGSRFHEVWREATLSGLSAVPCPPRSQMHRDYKFGDAERGFRYGIANPVPLADVSAREVDGQTVIYFTNGVTRTLWLLANGAEVFPVMVDQASRDTLSRAVGHR